MAENGGEVTKAVPVRRRRRRVTILGMLVWVGLAACSLFVLRTYILPRIVEERPTIVAPFRKVAPIADGRIGADEYGPGIAINFTADNGLGQLEMGMTDRSPNKAPDDLSLTLHAAYSDSALFLAFRVRDQFVDAQEVDRLKPHFNDAVEVFIDGDRISNDFFTPIGADGIGSSEGFQLIANAAGHQLTVSRSFTNADWKAAAQKTADGYIIELEIPLKLIDTLDGSPYAAAGPGSLLHFALAITDNDAETSQQMSYAFLRTRTTTNSPYWGREDSWKFAIKLEPRFSLFPW
jgi:hypothetical protein